MSRQNKFFDDLKKVAFLFLCIGLAINLEAQNLAQHNWYFGNSVNAIRFNRATNKAFIVKNKFIPFGTGGSAVATDPSTADLLFYTDGTKIYDATNVLMTNGTGLLANSSANQPVVICPLPGDSSKFLVFANTANYTVGGTITVSVVDMGLFGNAGPPPVPPLGAVSKKNMATGLAGRSEGMIVIPHSNGKDFWLVTHQDNSQNYSASLITKTSYNPAGAGSFAFTTTVVSGGIGSSISVANFSYNSRNKRLAVSAQNPNTDALILTFDDGSGVPPNPVSPGAMTLDRSIPNSGANGTTSIYDIQWDNAGQYIYFSRVSDASGNGDVLQYDYNNPLISLASVLQATEYRSWGLELAPDSAIYHLYQATNGGPFLVEKFTKTDTVASSVIQTQLPGALDFKGTQFPSFIPKINFTPILSFIYSTPTCQNNNITFFPSVSPNPDSLHWDFGDTTGVNNWSPVHKFKRGVNYTVTLTAYFQGTSQSTTQSIVITPFDLKLTLVSDTTACHCQLPVNKSACTMPQFSVTAKTSGGSGTPQFFWSDGKTTTATFKPDSAGYYYVTVTDGSGCSTYAGVNIKEYGKTDQRSNIWYFGNKAGIDFNPPTPVALNKSAMNTPDGCAITCDRNGQVIFYTNGNQVWNRKNKSIAKGIGGDSTSTQSSLIVPVPGDETLYYIFTTQSIFANDGNELRYSLFDLKLDSGFGAVVQKNILLFSKSTERVTASPDWLIAHEYGNNTFRAYKISAQGLGDPVYSAIGSDHSFQNPVNGEGYMKLSSLSDLAVALANPGTSNLVELFHFSDSTGVVSNYRKITLSNTTGQVYGIEFSGSGNKLFASVMGTPSSDIYEYSIDSVGHPYLKKDNVENATIGALQISPKNTIYAAINNSTVLASFQPAADTAQVTSINMSGFTLAAGTNSFLGLPNFRQQQSSGFGGPGFTATGLCLGDSTAFVGTPTDPIDKFQWFFGDGGSSTKGTIKHLYANAGTYSVSMRLTNRCGLDTIITQKIVINAPPAKPSLAPATPICNAAVILNANLPNTSGLTYLWSTGDTTKTISVSVPIIVEVTNTDKATGCFSSAVGAVVDNRPQVNLGPDLTICQNTPIGNLDAQNPGDTYTWTITNVTANTSVPGTITQTQPVTTNAVGVFKYSVVVTDPVTSCVTNAQKTFTINQLPTFSISGTDPSSCFATNGSVSLTLINTSPDLYSYSLTGPSTFTPVTGTDQNAATQSFTSPTYSLGGGTYTATITDQISQCAASHSVGLNGGAFTVTPSILSNCDPPVITITTNATAPWSYIVTNASTGVATSGSSISTGSTQVNLPSQGVPGSTVSYVVQVADASNCVVIANPNLPITTTALPAMTIVSDLCSNPATLTASVVGGATSFSWKGTGITGSTPGQVLNIPTVGTGTYTATATSTTAGCPVSQSATVNYNGPITPDFTFDPCQTQVVLSATPTGNYTYRWYKNGTLLPSPFIGSQITLNIGDDGTYQVEVVDGQSGCSIQSASKPVQILGNMTASLTAPLICDDGTPFVITASTNAVGATYTWTLPNGTSFTNSFDTLKRTPAGLYKVDVKLASCDVQTSIQITKAPIPYGNLLSAYRICNDPQYPNLRTTQDLDPGFFSSYNWFKNNVTIPYTLEVYTATEEGHYRVDLENSIGCSNSDLTEVINDCEPIVTGPNAFRPASSHTDNSTFYLFTYFISNFEIIVYNRWGEAVFESKDDKFKWNGGYNNNTGQPLPGGTYTYLVRYVSSFHPDQGVQEQRGGVVLLR